jgi:dTDP-4-dehydrorhamnose reductase
MRVAVVGANGQLGSDIVSAFAEQGHDVRPLTHLEIEITDRSSVSRVMGSLKPDVIVNTAAMHHVEQCEQDPERAFAVNAIGPRNLALEASVLGSALVQISTDYVFDGTKRVPYVEDDTPLPLNAYGTTKLAGEHFVRCAMERHFIVRTSGLCGKQPCRGKGGLNFIDLMLKLARERGEVRVVDDEVLSPTMTQDLARQVVTLSGSEFYGIYHATAEGSCSWHEFAREIFTMTGTSVKLNIAQPGEFPAKVPRPKYSVLENRALKLHNLNVLRPWRDGLRDYLGVSEACAAVR